jgi:hypothetical protein
MDWSDLDRRIEELERNATPGMFFGQPDYEAAWDLIKEVGGSFKGTRYPTKREKDAAWSRFQAAVDQVKAGQRAGHERRSAVSSTHCDRILWHVERARPARGIVLDLIEATAGTAASLLTAGLLDTSAFDDTKDELKALSAELQEGWDYLTKHKAEILGRDKARAFEGLKEVQDILDREWEEWKRSKSAQFEAKQSRWRAKQEAHIEDLRGRLENAYGALERRERHLEKLHDDRANAWSDSFIERIEGWIDEEEERIADIKASIKRFEEWLEEARSRL